MAENEVKNDVVKSEADAKSKPKSSDENKVISGGIKEDVVGSTFI